ncbi:ribose-phosphate pyrophosphokinase [Variovorax paradoxus]|nr:ribose-phosphate pyrophosphokinase [Variovorax paradoxus]
MPGNEQLAEELAIRLGLERGVATVRRFPDGESYVRIESPVDGRGTIIVCTLDRPDDKLVPLFLLAAALREAGARSVGLVAPYLAYMRQDRRFQPGETISAHHVGAWISQCADWLLTVDPHLHRITDLSQVCSVPAHAVHAAQSMAQWIREHVRDPLLIGPDEESAQWVGAVAQHALAPFVVLRKTRRGDRDVEVPLPDVERWRSRTPVLVDDIVSTARTMIETVGHLRQAGLAAPVCVAVHAVFAQTAFEDLRAAGAGEIVSCDTIRHPSNRIPLAAAIAAGVRTLLPA